MNTASLSVVEASISFDEYDAVPRGVLQYFADADEIVLQLAAEVDEVFLPLEMREYAVAYR
jgi:hypothetical protein